MTVITASPAVSRGAAAEPSAAERLFAGASDLWRELAGLDPREVAVNLAFSLLILAAAWGLAWSLRRIFDFWLRRFAARTGAADGRQAPRAVGLTWRLVRLSIWGASLLFVAAVWGIEPLSWFGDGVGARILRAAGVVILAVGAVEVAGFAIDRLMAGIAARSGVSRRGAQIRTLGPIVRGALQSVLVVVAAITLLAEAGVNVAPLIASAGVVGLAIGFGAQTIVKDFLTGLFLILEDVVSVGDNVRIADVGGAVEAMTIRTIRLRDQDGTLHIFPYSEAQVIHNRTKSYSSYLVEILATYGTDIDAALEVMARVGEELAQDPAYRVDVTKPFETLGVDRLDPTGVVLKGRITTRPRRQWDVGREYNRRLKRAFDEAGIEIAYRPMGPPAATQPTAPSAAPPSVDVGRAEAESPPARASRS